MEFQQFEDQGQDVRQQISQPTSPPPSFVPQPQVSQGQITTFAVDPGAIRGCLRRWTYMWLRDGEQFWFFPVFIGRTSVAGYRWIGTRFIYFGVDLKRIVQFRCF